MTNTTEPCLIHRWILELPNGPVITGTCRYCKTTRTWPASPETVAMGAPHKHRKRREV